MKADIHPADYRLVVFEDLNNGQRFLTKSTAPSQETIKWEDGQSYPLIKVHISGASHPFYTGQEKLIDIEGRVDKFKARQEFAAAAQKRRAQTDQPAVKDKNQAQSETKSKPAKATKTPAPAKSKPAQGES